MNCRQYVYNYLCTHPCQECGESDPACLSFHHVDPKDKSFNISKARTSKKINLRIIKQEIAKCQVLCLNCHAKITSQEQGWYRNLNK